MSTQSGTAWGTAAARHVTRHKRDIGRYTSAQASSRRRPPRSIGRHLATGAVAAIASRGRWPEVAKHVWQDKEITTGVAYYPAHLTALRRRL